MYTDMPQHITIDAQQKVDVLYLLHNQEKNIHVSIRKGGQLRLHVIVYGNHTDNASLDMIVSLEEEYAQADVHMLSLVSWYTKINANTAIQIQPNAQKTKAYLLQENVLLSDTVRVYGTPQLDIHANDVQASHGARYEKIDDTKLFYMMSRGLNKSQAIKSIIGGYIHYISDFFPTFNDQQRQQKIISYMI